LHILTITHLHINFSVDLSKRDRDIENRQIKSPVVSIMRQQQQQPSIRSSARNRQQQHFGHLETIA
jgi:hypothetical protein